MSARTAWHAFAQTNHPASGTWKRNGCYRSGVFGHVRLQGSCMSQFLAIGPTR